MNTQIKPRTFIGQSSQGSIEEAIENAFQQAKETLQSSFINWRLLEISGGYGGFTEARDLAVRIAATPPVANKKDRANAPAEVPDLLTGFISDLPPYSTCQDGATHLLCSGFVGSTPDTRLRATNDEALAALQKAVTDGTQTTVIGYHRPAPSEDCRRFDVYYAAPTTEIFHRLGIKSS